MMFILPDTLLIELSDKSKECKEIAIVRVMIKKHPVIIHQQI